MKRIGEILNHIALIRSKRHLSKKQRRTVLRTYFGLIIKRFARSRFSWMFDYTHHKLLNFHIEIDRFESLYWIFLEIFVNENYYFETDNKKSFIIDGGSNIGLSILYFKFVYPDANILAFEPHPKYADVLKRNLESNNISDVEIIQAGLGKVPGEIEIFTQSTGSTVYEEFAHKQVQIKYDSFGSKVKTRIEKLSERIQGRRVDFLKLDVEGAEADIFEELNESGAIARVDQISMEYHAFSPDQNTLSSIARVLETNNFEYTCGGDARNLASVPDRNYKTFMVFARKA